MDFRSFLKNNIVVLDGGMGSLLQRRGLRPGEKPEEWNVSRPDVITEIHKEYFDSGANVVYANTFGANSFKFSDEELEIFASLLVRMQENLKNIAPLEICGGESANTPRKETKE